VLNSSSHRQNNTASNSYELFSEKKLDAETAPALSYTLNEGPETLFLPPGRQRQTSQWRSPHPHGRRQGLLRPNQGPLDTSRHALPPLPPIHARNLTAPGLSSSTAANQNEVPKGNRGTQTTAPPHHNTTTWHSPPNVPPSRHERNDQPPQTNLTLPPQPVDKPSHQS